MLFRAARSRGRSLDCASDAPSTQEDDGQGHQEKDHDGNTDRRKCRDVMHPRIRRDGDGDFRIVVLGLHAVAGCRVDVLRRRFRDLRRDGVLAHLKRRLLPRELHEPAASQLRDGAFERLIRDPAGQIEPRGLRPEAR